MELFPSSAKLSVTESIAKELPAQGLLSRPPHAPHEASSAVKPSSRREWVADLLAGFAAYYLTSLPVLLGVMFGMEFLYPASGGVFVPGANPVDACIHFDALHYLNIIRHGYSYHPAQRSLVAFFPAYPLLGRSIAKATGLPPAEAALLTANLVLVGAFVLLARYVRVRWPEASIGQRLLVLAIFGLWPVGLFFRMPYAESLFVCGTLIVLYGMARDWPLLVLALLTGFVTAVRPVGVALTAAFVWYIVTPPGFRLRSKAGQVLLLALVACWGLLAYMGYQWLAFGTPWAFAQTQENWSFLAPQDRSWSGKVLSLAMLEPIWSVYVPSHRRYWSTTNDVIDPVFSLICWNPVLFVLAGVLLLMGGLKRWLTSSELVLGACLLAIPYLTRSYEMSMASHGRFAAVVIVNYLVIGRLLAQAASLVVAGLCVVLALWLCLFTSLYAVNHLIF
jgi:hypothetical protein